MDNIDELIVDDALRGQWSDSFTALMASILLYIGVSGCRWRPSQFETSWRCPSARVPDADCVADKVYQATVTGVGDAKNTSTGRGVEKKVRWDKHVRRGAMAGPLGL